MMERMEGKNFTDLAQEFFASLDPEAVSKMTEADTVFLKKVFNGTVSEAEVDAYEVSELTPSVGERKPLVEALVKEGRSRIAKNEAADRDFDQR